MGALINISDVAIRMDAEGRYCLNDLHKASGGNPNHRPGEWMRNKQTQALIAEMGGAGIPAGPVSTLNDGATNGTYVAKELVYAYAMWISPAFHLKVIRAYDAMASKPAPELSRMEVLKLALASEEARLKAEAERDEAIRTKALIGSKREATAMASASAAKREADRLRDELGFSARHATVTAVEHATGTKFD